MDEVSLSYILSRPSSLGLDLRHPTALLLLAAGALFLLPTLPAIRRAVVVLRIVSFAAIVLSIAGLGLTTALPAAPLTVVTAVDVSRSMGDSAIEWSRRYLGSLTSSLAPGDQLWIVPFAESAHFAPTSGKAADLDTLVRPDEALGTDITAAIDQSLALFPPVSEKVLLLLSDGNETRGDSRGRLETLRALDIRVDAASPPREETFAVRIARLTAPTVVAPERPLPLHLLIRNSGSARPALLNLYLDNRISDSVAVDLVAGVNVFEFLLRVTDPGGHGIRAEILADWPNTTVSSSREVSIHVRSGTRVLLATGRRHSSLTTALEARGVSVVRVSPAQLPTDVAGYSSAHLVVLEDLRGTDVGARQAAAIEQFVRIRGGGLLFVGGARTYGDRAFHGTDLPKILPVSLEPSRPRPGKRDPLALFLVIDRSNSMGFNSRIGTLRDGEKLRYAIKAGVAVVKQLKDDDRVGVIAFDARPHEIAPLQPLTLNRARLLDALPRIVESGGTDFFDALVSAGEQLARSRIARKHIVLLTDGDTNRADRGEYRDLVKELAAQGVSVTTIRIGDNQVNLKLLQEISDGTGGSFHYVEDVQMLPDLMLRDTSRALRASAPETDQFYPSIGMQHRLLMGTDEGEIPHLRDYAFSKPKPSSETLLHVARADRHDPILSVWRYGLGRVGSFTASPADDAESWPAWAGFARFWSQIAFWAARLENDDDIVVEAVRRRDATILTARTSGRTVSGPTVVGTMDVEGRTVEIDFTNMGRAVLQATAPVLPPGRHRIALRMRSAGALHVVETTVAVPQRFQNELEEFDHDGDNLELLRQLTAQTGGTLNATARDVTKRPAGTRRARFPLSGILIAVALSAFFADIALRRLARP